SILRPRLAAPGPGWALQWAAFHAGYADTKDNVDRESCAKVRSLEFQPPCRSIGLRRGRVRGPGGTTSALDHRTIDWYMQTLVRAERGLAILVPPMVSR